MFQRSGFRHLDRHRKLTAGGIGEGRVRSNAEEARPIHRERSHKSEREPDPEDAKRALAPA